MQITGCNFIGAEESKRGERTFKAFDPAAETELAPQFHEATSQEVDAAILKAEQAFASYSRRSGLERAAFLEKIADEIMALGDALLQRCSEETGLPLARLTGERGRTVGQLRMFAQLLREGSWVDARIETAMPDRQPLPKPDVRSMRRALGPVGIFGASNFPLAFSVAGGDTASALAAGCTIVVKAHPAHPGTCEMVARAILSASQKSGMPDGTFSMLQGKSNDVGMAIVTHPLIKAIGFTGSFKGGKAIFNAANRRPEPIPVYAEMGSSNPVFILPGAMKKHSAAIAKGLAGSVTLGVGQFCTNPGLVFQMDAGDLTAFQSALSEAFQKAPSATMLTPQIHAAFQDAVASTAAQKGVNILASGAQTAGLQGVPHVLQTDAASYIENQQLEDEIFGPSTLSVTAKNKAELLDIASKLHGHLTATLWATDEDLESHTELIHTLERKVGRLIRNGFPTGVEVCHAMVHGGPFPATTDSRTTSVGTAAIDRFARPVCFQNFPDKLLPDELKNTNPLGIWRLINGEMSKGLL